MTSRLTRCRTPGSLAARLGRPVGCRRRQARRAEDERPRQGSLEGQVERISADLSGSGSLEARRLTVRQSDVNVRGPGSARVNPVRKESGRAEVVAVERSGRLLVE
ncbi:hypothetical protein G4G28_07240 [Massilia sp. Dwa41.01b]|uniref:GIN domain-containing protein n=1 Tax=Massilia sp. Dwa41.01b TaxID=2709302 RepID=UPI0015FFB03D|nr:DUF2807 domain-containing protein [Massilia sp. Dwa41.01b]QNA88349.1 hypothetical protein G4G28_07240 [Massilia sp. Dwa41.01b]